MKTVICNLAVMLVLLIIKTESQIPTSQICEVYNPTCRGTSCPKYIPCTSTPGRITHCFALMTDTPRGPKVLRKGCWLQNLLLCPLEYQCKAKQLYRHRLHFCCCTGDNCNSKITY